MQETWARSLGQEDPLEKETETHSSNLTWEIPWTEEPGGLQSVRSQRVGHDLVINSKNSSDLPPQGLSHWPLQSLPVNTP